MANFSVMITDNNDGTYTSVTRVNPTTTPAGGTILSSPTHNETANVQDPKELMELAKARIANYLSANLVE